MSKSVKLKNNLYLDTRGIVHNKKILNTILFPIGYVYLSVNNTNPGTIFGGKWEQISGYYLYLGTGGTKTNYTGIGTQSHTLTANQSGLPAHNHNIHSPFYKFSELCYGFHGDVYKGDMHQDSWTNTEYAGGSNASEGHSHNIATFQVYAWKRVS